MSVPPDDADGPTPRRKRTSERTMTKADWIALHRLMEMARIVCLHGVEALQPARKER